MDKTSSRVLVEEGDWSGLEDRGEEECSKYDDGYCFELLIVGVNNVLCK